MSNEFHHVSVLLEECIEGLNIKPDGIYVDGTLGGAGHSSQIAKRLTTGRLIGIDRDQVALKAAGESEKLCFLHYPPYYTGYTCEPILEILEKYQVKTCYYGHLHGPSHKLCMEGQWDGVDFHLVAADYIDFKPLTVVP